MPIQTSFNAGEFSSLMGGDVDLDKRAFSVSLMENMIALKQGPAVTRGPTNFVNEVKDSDNKTAIRKFEFSDTDAIQIEIGDLYFRFYKEYEQILNAGTPVELATPYAQADLFDADGVLLLNFAQSADVMYITHPSYPIYALTRVSDISWSLTEIDLDDGPYLDLNGTSTTITPSGTSGSVSLTASAALFAATDIGRVVRVLHGSTWGWATITAYTSTTVVTATTGSNFGATTASVSWRLGVYSETTGYPSAITFFQDRVALNGSTSDPDFYALSKTSGYSPTNISFQPTNASGVVADDNAITGRVPSGQVNNIRWLASDSKGMIIGTSKEEFLLRANSLGDTITPTNKNIVPLSATGGSIIPPIKTINGSAFIQEFRRRVFDVVYTYEQDSLKPKDLTLAAEHITRGQIIDASYQKEPVNIIWFAKGDGKLVGMTHYPDQNVYGWHRHTISGTDSAVESISTIPSPDGQRDDLWMIVKRTINGSTKRYIEYMSRHYEDDMEVYEGARCDSRFSYIGASTSTVTGLSHLEGQTVKIMVDGKSHPDLVVSGGAITLANSRVGENIQIGLGYRWRLVTREVEIKLKNGDTAQGKIKRVSDVVLRLLNTLGLEYGKYNGTLYEYDFNQGQSFDETPALFSGDTETIAWPDGSDSNMQMEFSSDSVYPACIVALMYEITVQP